MVQTDEPQAGDTIAIMNTSKGEMKIRFFPELVEEGVKNFVELASQGKYDGVIFHRVIPGFMLQAGDFENGDGTGGHSFESEGSHICDDFSEELSHIRGALSWAKTAAPCSIGSQFFVVHPEDGAHFLDHKKGGGPAEGYTVFAQVFDGFEVIDTIAAVDTNHSDRPLEDVIIEKVEITTL